MQKKPGNLKLDIFPHIFPLAYFERMKRIAEGNPAHPDDEALARVQAGPDALHAGGGVPG
jgi:hypothetical protein